MSKYHVKMMFLCFWMVSNNYAMEMVPFQELSEDQNGKCYWVARYLVKCDGKLKIEEKTVATQFFEQKSLLSQRVQEYKNSMQDSDEKSEEFLKKVWGNTITEAYNAYCILPPAAQYQVAFCLRKNPFAFSLNREIDSYIPLDVQRKIFVLMNKEYRNNEILQEKSIESLFVGFIEYCKYKQYYEIYSKKLLVRSHWQDLKAGRHESRQIKLDCKIFTPLTVEEKILLCKLINGNIVAFSNENREKIKELTDEQKQSFGTPYAITLKELPVVQGIAKHKLPYIDYWSPSDTQMNDDLFTSLKFDIEYDRPTMKDKALIFIPYAMNALLPDLMYYVLHCGLLKQHDGWLSLYNVTCYTGGIVAVIVGRYLIGQYVFPFCEGNTSQVTQLKKFFGPNIRTDKRGGDFSTFNFSFRDVMRNGFCRLEFMICIFCHSFAFAGHYLFNMKNIVCKIIGGIINGYRLLVNIGFIKSSIIYNPLNRCSYRNLRDMAHNSLNK